MEEPLKQVYVPTVATPGGEKTQLGVFSSEQDAWDVMRAFLSKASATDVVHGNITAWEIDFVGEEGSFCLLYTSPSPRDKRQSRMPSSA